MHRDFLNGNIALPSRHGHRSLLHDGSGEEPGLKDPDGNWDLRPHRSRIIDVDRTTLETWHDLLESESVPLLQSRMVYTVNRSSANALAMLARQPRMASLGLEFSADGMRRIDRTKGLLRDGVGRHPRRGEE